MGVNIIESNSQTISPSACDAVLQKTKISYETRFELAEHIKSALDEIHNSNTTDNNGASMNILLPTDAGLIPIGFSYDKNKSSQDYESMLSSYEEKYNMKFSEHKYVEFLPPNEVQAWSDCMVNITNSIGFVSFSKILDENDPNKKTVVFNICTPTQIAGIKIPDRSKANYSYINEEGEVKNKEMTLKAGECKTERFKYNPKNDFYLTINPEISQKPITLFIPREITTPSPTYKNRYYLKDSIMGDFGCGSSREILINNLKPNTLYKVIWEVNLAVSPECKLDYAKHQSWHLVASAMVNGVSKGLDYGTYFYEGSNTQPSKYYSGDNEVVTSSDGSISFSVANIGTQCQGNNTGMSFTIVNLSIIRLGDDPINK